MSHELMARAAVLPMPDDAVLGGRSAACWYGAPFAGVTDPVIVIVPPTSAWRGPQGVRAHRSELGRTDVTTVQDGDIRLTTAPRTAWDLATLETTPAAVAALDGMVRSGAPELEVLRRTHVHARVLAGQPGGEGDPTRRRSQRESAGVLGARRLRARGPPAPVPQFVVLEAGQFLGRVDLAWPEHRLPGVRGRAPLRRSADPSGRRAIRASCGLGLADRPAQRRRSEGPRGGGPAHRRRHPRIDLGELKDFRRRKFLETTADAGLPGERRRPS